MENCCRRRVMKFDDLHRSSNLWRVTLLAKRSEALMGAKS